MSTYGCNGYYVAWILVTEEKTLIARLRGSQAGSTSRPAVTLRLIEGACGPVGIHPYLCWMEDKEYCVLPTLGVMADSENWLSYYCMQEDRCSITSSII